ncbi:ferrochelatase [Pseudofulvimonas gallinarii]|jgi:ferrochelatase|uniref:Ferrochelatase n=1 Tax=Pseudofulvimonas gallinarii TaxID=634155 RepID=A0A4R3LA51_9GAMM|nr:ferrochelatase [Pseudofulvimonas gallinarii]TCS96030.1 ferrochelatase [Pseudofulvimonas gallinarii]THD13299.1 ferrochelatase [Pseudofulvimonas gallinarii]
MYRSIPVADPAGAGRSAVVLVNLGTPDAPKTADVRRYLRQFLSDPRVVEQPRWLWLPILHGIILPLRSRRSAHAYSTVWSDRGSPLAFHTRALTDAVRDRLPASVEVEMAMRYGQPSIADVLRRLDHDGCLQRLLVLPLYPQYSATTTASVFDAVMAELATWRRIPAVRFVDEYCSLPDWQAAVAGSLQRHWQAQGRGDHLLFSFHGIPQRYVDAGDPYYGQCRASAAAIAARLGLAADQWSISFQSRVGREPWLQPYTDARIPELAAAGVRRLDVACPGFAADCLETLEEVAMQYRDLFLGSGGERFDYVPALNDDAGHADALAELVRAQCADWPPFADRTA